MLLLIHAQRIGKQIKAVLSQNNLARKPSKSELNDSLRAEKSQARQRRSAEPYSHVQQGPQPDLQLNLCHEQYPDLVCTGLAQGTPKVFQGRPGPLGEQQPEVRIFAVQQRKRELRAGRKQALLDI